MAMVPTVLPLNVDFTAFQVLMPVRGKEFVVVAHDVETGKPLRVAKLDCCSELRKLLSGLERIIQERLNESMDVTTFSEELLLDYILVAQPQVKLPADGFTLMYAIYSDGRFGLGRCNYTPCNRVLLDLCQIK